MLLIILIVVGAVACGGGNAGHPTPPPIDDPEPPAVETCAGTGNTNHILPSGSTSTDLQINGVNCVVDGTGAAGSVPGSYVYRNVNILNGGSLTFQDAPIDFHAHSILVEMGGTLQAGTGSPIQGPITIWLWGSANDGIPSITCLSDSKNQCGLSDNAWNSNPSMAMKQMSFMGCTPGSQVGFPQPNDDCFYQYDVMESGDIAGAYFGRKVLAVSAGGTLMLRGAKGIRSGEIEANPADSSTSWGRLTTTLSGGETYFYLDRNVSGSWAAGDHIVVTTTDYLPSHTEELVIKAITNDSNGTRIDIDPSVPAPMNAIRYHHNGQSYDYSAVAADHPNTGPAPDASVTNLAPQNIETRSVVALLSRSIRIASEGGTPTFDRTADHFPATAGNYYGGHTLYRQGFTTVQLQGVEFYQLGQGGNMGHYPVHFHMARSVPQPNLPADFFGTYIADSSIVDSMTRFITVHATQGVTLARNVGYLSIGHGFYLEDATETNNRIYSNVGISVRGAVANSQNPRLTPGILDYNDGAQGSQIPDIPPKYSDVVNPSTFWIMNTWNDFQYNAAVGVGSCGACYWMPPGGISGPSRYESWTGYASMQKDVPNYGQTPLMTFKGNSCSTAMAALTTVGQTSPCNGVVFGPGTSDNSKLVSVPNPASRPLDDYPNQSLGQRTKATVCDSTHQGDCSLAPPCTSTPPGEANCMATVIDHFTTSFNWAPTNVASIWLRGWWYLLDNSAITDVQNGGLTFISGGGYTRSDAAQGYWAVLKNSVLVGNTQPNLSDGFPANPFASNGGPFNPKGLDCPYNPPFCVSPADGISFVGSNFGVNQRLFNIYDGPSSQYNNIYSDVQPTVLGTLSQCKADNSQPGNCVNLGWSSGYQIGVMQSPPTNQPGTNCILPNAAIAWKQPNGFYYPPAFKSSNLAFNNVGIRHFVIQPAYVPGTLQEDPALIQKTYCTWQPGMFSSSFTDIDRQTELTDLDGSLTGLTSNDTTQTPSDGPTISITKDPFYTAPVTTDECATGQQPPPTSSGDGATASTSPYQYLTTAIVAQCAIGGSCATNWSNQCSSPQCYGIPLYRQFLTQSEMTAYNADNSKRPSIRMMGQDNVQRSTLTINRGHYYIDTTVSIKTQQSSGPFINVFQPDAVYSVFFLYANNATKQTYSFFIGKGLTDDQARAAIIPARVTTPDLTYPTTEFADGSWVSFSTYDADTGLVTVNIDLSAQQDLAPENRAAFCQPTTFCSWNSATSSCGCKADSGCTDDQVCSFATKDIDCPVAGCYGFNIHMPDAFVAAPQDGLPAAPVLYTDADPYFQPGTVTFVPASADVAGGCHYTAPPTPQLKEKLLPR
ncbi:MAG: G8 domain-containing protein [Acidobacteria bacterium]|nr:G8 domain-containing protein [Acidobacteriota bacterium]